MRGSQNLRMWPATPSTASAWSGIAAKNAAPDGYTLFIGTQPHQHAPKGCRQLHSQPQPDRQPTPVIQQGYPGCEQDAGNKIPIRRQQQSGCEPAAHDCHATHAWYGCLMQGAFIGFIHEDTATHQHP